MRTTKILLALSASFIFNYVAMAAEADDILGYWVTEETSATIEIFKEGETYKGKMVWLKRLHEGEKEVLDKNNPDEKLQSRSLLGLVNLDGFKYDGDGEWVDGEIYDPKKGKTYSAKMEIEDGELHLRGYVGIPLFGRTAVWKRSETVVPESMGE